MTPRRPPYNLQSFLAAACLVLTLPRTVAAAPPRDPAEPVPTARREPVTWRHTLNRPADAWTSPSFDDANWEPAPAPFGSPGTPGITPNTRWTTRDIWLRRPITLPTTAFDPAALQFLAFHDEDVEIYLDGTLAARGRGFVTNYEYLDILPDARRLLKPGATLLLAVHCRQNGGGQGIDVGIGRPSPSMLAARRRTQYRNFAVANPGNPAAGRALFDDARLACNRCHTVDGSASRAGPDLSTVGDKFPRPELADHVLNPSATIAVGYETTLVNTRSGDTLVGVLKESSPTHLGLLDGAGKLQRIPAADVASRRTQPATSLMPTDLESGLSRPEFADLVEYLVSLRLPATADAGRAGMPSSIPNLNPPVALTPIHPPDLRFDHPCAMEQVPGQPHTFLVCEHETGRIYRLTTSPPTKSLFANFRTEIRPGGATGLLGIALHPRFPENRRYFIQHQLIVNNRLVARVTEKRASEDLTRDSGTPSRTVLEFPCSTDVHTGGHVAFGPDNFLYIGMGDTGPQNDPEGHGQDLTSLLGKMLRIDVDHEQDGKPYSIPADNPFINRPTARPEIYAYGFREPWRFSFDPKTHGLWVGDVGQDRIEEVSIVPKGANLGWNVYEGFDLFSNRYRSESKVPFLPPVFAYNRRLGNSITGGFVYRNTGNNAAFDGLYICGDFTSKRVWGLKQADNKLQSVHQLCTSPQSIASFARDDAGDLYLVGYEGTIYRLEFGQAAAPGPLSKS